LQQVLPLAASPADFHGVAEFLQKSGNCQSAWPLTQAAPARRSSMMGSHTAWVTQGDKRSVHQASTPFFSYHKFSFGLPATTTQLPQPQLQLAHFTFPNSTPASPQHQPPIPLAYAQLPSHAVCSLHTPLSYLFRSGYFSAPTAHATAHAHYSYACCWSTAWGRGPFARIACIQVSGFTFYCTVCNDRGVD